MVHGLLGTGMHSRRWMAGVAREASSVFTTSPHCWHHHLSSTSYQISSGIKSLKAAWTLLLIAHARDLCCEHLMRVWGGAEAVMLALKSSCKYRLSSAERFDCTETKINQLFADSYQIPISEWQVTIKLHLVSGFIVASELTYFNCRASSGGRL